MTDRGPAGRDRSGVGTRLQTIEKEAPQTPASVMVNNDRCTPIGHDRSIPAPIGHVLGDRRIGHGRGG